MATVKQLLNMRPIPVVAVDKQQASITSNDMGAFTCGPRKLMNACLGLNNTAAVAVPSDSQTIAAGSSTSTFTASVTEAVGVKIKVGFPDTVGLGNLSVAITKVDDRNQTVLQNFVLSPIKREFEVVAFFATRFSDKVMPLKASPAKFQGTGLAANVAAVLSVVTSGNNGVSVTVELLTANHPDILELD